MRLDLGQLVSALARTIDLVGIDEVHHGRRVAYMADIFAARLGLSVDQRAQLYRAALLHDCGVSSTEVHRSLVSELDWQDSELHCRIGAERLASFAPLAPLAATVRWHHTRWQLLQTIDLDEGDRLRANLVFLADRIDALQAQRGLSANLLGKEELQRTIASYSGSYFFPEAVEAFLAVSGGEAFWIGMEPHFLEENVLLPPDWQEETVVEEDGLVAMAGIFADVVDAKSPYTAEHSRRVADVAAYLAERCGLAPETCRRVRVAGLLHDLGKLQIPDAILESPQPLDAVEAATMRHHSYVTYSILRHIDGLEDITRWACEHHERLDGGGYPFRRGAAALCLESRIVMVADIFQALAQNRPYRDSLPPQAVLGILRDEQQGGRLDGSLVDLVERELASCYRIALEGPRQETDAGAEEVRR
jgi:putative nucleotidyltransferase with HDIG domain